MIMSLRSQFATLNEGYKNMVVSKMEITTQHPKKYNYGRK